MPGNHPKEALPKVLVGLRMLPAPIGLSPFLLLYKQEPQWPLGEAMLVGGDTGDLPDEVPEDTWWQ